MTMAGHSRKRSRGSIFSLSLDAVRSLSRAGSRQAVHVLADDEHFSCPSSPKSPSKNRPCSRPSNLQHQTLDTNRGHLPTSKTQDLGTSKKPRVPRPLSWLTGPRAFGAKGKVDRSISAPILTSTTNPDVARVEGLRCGELAQTDLTHSRWDSRAGWVVENCTETGIPATTNDTDDSGMNSDRTLEAKSGKRGRYAAFGSLKKAMKFRSSKSTTAADFTPSSEKDKACVSDVLSSSLRVSSRKAEGLNLCKEKIRDLTGNGNIRRKPINGDKDLTLERKATEDDYLLATDLDADLIRVSDEVSPQEHFQTTGSFDFGNLEISFVNAIEQLDIQQPAVLLQSALEKGAQMLLTDEPELQGPRVPDPSATSVSTTHGISTSTPNACIFSASQGNLVALPRSSRVNLDIDHSRRMQHPFGVNPLQCHPHVMGFAQHDRDRHMISSPTSQSTPRIEITNEEDHEVGDLYDAPIFSPSSGDLTQYARTTPSSARSTPSFYTAPLLSPSNLPEVPLYTPTRPSGKQPERALQHRGWRPVRGGRSGQRAFHAPFYDNAHPRTRSMIPSSHHYPKHVLAPKDRNMSIDSSGREQAHEKKVKTDNPKAILHHLPAEEGRAVQGGPLQGVKQRGSEQTTAPALAVAEMLEGQG